jgi:hypothetical protein
MKRSPIYGMASSKAPPCSSPDWATNSATCPRKMRNVPQRAALQMFDRHHPIGVLLVVFRD